MTAVQFDLTDIPAPTFPVATLVERVGDDTMLAELISKDRTWVSRRRRVGPALDVYEADRWAIAAGYLPHEVWPEWARVEFEAVAS